MLSRAGVRLVNAKWGPRDGMASLAKLAALGWRPTQVIDVGAWQGTWTTECRGLFPDAKYLLIDPLPENRPILERFAANTPNVTVWSGAAGAECGSLAIHSHADQSSALSSNVAAWQARDTISVPMRTLDSFLESGEVQPPQLLKADVQGYELEVLRGATNVLRSLDAALLEVSFRELYAGQPLAHDIVVAMADSGFKLFDICTYAQDARGELVQSDFLFVRRDWPTPRGDNHG